MEDLSQKLISDQERVNNILKKFPVNIGGGNNNLTGTENIWSAYTELTDFIASKSKESSVRVCDAANVWMEKKETNLLGLSKYLEVDSTILKRAGCVSPSKRMVSSKKTEPTWFPYNCAESFCYNVAKTSCHNLYLGMKGVTLLPHRFSSLLELMKQSGDVESLRSTFLFIIGGTMEEKTSRELLPMFRENYNNKPPEFCKKRLDEICADRCVPPECVIRNVPVSIKTRLNGLFTEAKTKPKTSTVLSLALMIGTSVDYFTSYDYLSRTRAYYYSPEGKKCMVSAKDHSWLSTLVALPEDLQNELLVRMCVAAIQSIPRPRADNPYTNELC